MTWPPTRSRRYGSTCQWTSFSLRSAAPPNQKRPAPALEGAWGGDIHLLENQLLLAHGARARTGCRTISHSHRSGARRAFATLSRVVRRDLLAGRAGARGASAATGVKGPWADACAALW